MLAQFPRRVVQADLDGDGELDYLVYAPAKIEGGIACHVQSSNGAMLAYLPKAADGKPRQFEFSATGPVKLNSRWLKDFSSWRGDTMESPEFTSQYLFHLDKSYHALAAVAPEIDKGIRVSWIVDRKIWRIEVHSGATQ